MTIKDYREAADKYIQDSCKNNDYLELGLRGEIGEVCDQIKRIIRDDKGVITEARAEAIMYELGDVMWYDVMLRRYGKVTFHDTRRIVLHTYVRDYLFLDKDRRDIEDDKIAMLAKQAKALYKDARSGGIEIVNVEKIAAILGYSLEQVCKANLAKLESRYNRGVINGEGDKR